MAGHSKWAQIKRQKGVADARRSAVFSKLANALTLAARQGTDPEMNFQLRLAIDRAKTANMPKDNIERAIERVKNAAAGGLEEVTFEAYGPGGAALMIETTTDNRNRALGEIRAVLNKCGGKLAEAGSVGYLFKKRGLLVVPTTNVEATELAAIEAGAEDFDSSQDKVFIYTDPSQLQAVRTNLIAHDITPSEASLELEPTAVLTITEPAAAKKVLNLVEALDELDDVTNVASNFEIDATLLEA